MIAALRAVRPQTMAVDEAHCIAHWGHEFRPEYRGLRKAADAIGIRQIVAVTATAAPPTRAEIIDNLFRSPPRVFAGSFERPNLSHRVERRRAGQRQIYRFLTEHRNQCGIVYCATREKTDRLARQIRDAGFNALSYHAGLDGGTRHAHQDEFVSANGVVMVATIAFGMGIDKADVRFICHADLPSSMETYYQETGRAGRDGLPAETLLLYSAHELTARRLQLAEIPDPDRQHEAAARLALLEQFCRAPLCRQQMLLRALGDDGAPCGRCDNCRRGFMRMRSAVQFPLTGAAHAREKVASMFRSVLNRGMKPHEDSADEVRASALGTARLERMPALTVAQQRAVLRMKSARLAYARKRRCSPPSIASDKVLHELALAEPLSPDRIGDTLARHDIRDPALTQHLYDVLRRELQDT
jgi:ATP-dependent DNA helicase RecQ